MAKPSGNGSSGSSSLGRSFSTDGSILTNNKTFQDFSSTSNTTAFSNSNDFLYITDAADYNAVTGLSFNGRGGADQIIFEEDDLTIGDAYFTNFSSFEVVKLANNLDVDFTGSSLTLGYQAFEAGIREVTGGNEDDVITFNAAYDGVSVKVDGGASEDTITTAGGNDTINGGAGIDTITGGAGIDTITGGAGNDILDGGAGNDTYVFSCVTLPSNGTDTIVTFDGAGVGAGDTLQFSFAAANAAIFAATTVAGTLVAGTLLPGNFVSGAGAVAGDVDDYFFYDTTTGYLWFDADGSGGGAAAVQLATLTGQPPIDYNDIVLA